MYKRVLLMLAVFTIVLAACNSNTSSSSGNSGDIPKLIIKAPTSVQALADDKLIKAYIAANKINAQKDSASGLYYQIIKPGTGAKANLNSRVNITYVGKLLNGTVFDQSAQAITFPLAQLIPGWQVGIPLVKSGGSVLLIIPSELGYGSESPSEKIPANSILIFNINVYNVI